MDFEALYELLDDNKIEFYQRISDSVYYLHFEDKNSFKRANSLKGRIAKYIPKERTRWHHNTHILEINTQQEG